MAAMAGYNFSTKASLGVCLTMVGGYVDAVGWLLLYHVFTAHMSGDTVWTGIHLAEGDWGMALHHAFPIPCFFAGVVAGAVMSELLIRRGHRSLFTLNLAIEGVLVVALAAGALAGAVDKPYTPLYYLMVALPALTMGLQNVTIRYVGRLPVRTTYITGILTGCAESSVAYLFWVLSERTKSESWKRIVTRSPLERSFRRAIVLGAFWWGYFFGAAAGALVENAVGPASLFLPAALLFAFSALDLLYPLAMPKRRKQIIHGGS